MGEAVDRDDERLRAARATFAREIAGLTGRDAPEEHVRALLVAAGTIASGDAGRSVTGIDERVRSAVRRALDRVTLPELDAAARDLAAALEGGAHERARAALATRTEVELLRHGAVLVLREPFAWSGRARERVTAFDDTVEAHAFRLVALNAWRREESAWIAPRRRAEFWWLTRGAELPADTVERMADVAALVARFAPARAAFDDLVRAAERAAPGGSSSTKRIVRAPSLQGWLDAGQRVDGAPVPLANDPAWEVSFRAPETLHVRVRTPLRVGERPILRAGIGHREMEPVATARMKYEARLDVRERMAARLTIVLPFPDGDRAIDVLERLR